MGPDYLKQSLGGYDSALLAVFGRLEELDRRLRNMLIAGQVSEIHPSGKLINVAYGNRSTGWIKWFSSAAGEIADYRCPSVGEQCLLLNYGGGENSSQAWALCGVASDQFPLPGDGDPEKRITVYGDGVTETVDKAGGVKVEASQVFDIETPGKFKVIASESADVVTDGVATVKAAERVLMDTPEAKGTGEVADSKRTMSGDRAIFDGHTHDEQGDGAPTSSPKQKQG